MCEALQGHVDRVLDEYGTWPDGIPDPEDLGESAIDVIAAWSYATGFANGCGVTVRELAADLGVVLYRECGCATIGDCAICAPVDINVGDRVGAGSEGSDDYDEGKVVAISDDTATVSWDSGVRTSIDLDGLRKVKP